MDSYRPTRYESKRYGPLIGCYGPLQATGYGRGSGHNRMAGYVLVRRGWGGPPLSSRRVGRPATRKPLPLMKILEPPGDDEEDNGLEVKRDEAQADRFGDKTKIVLVIVALAVLFTVPQLLLVIGYVGGQYGYGIMSGNYAVENDNLQRTLDLMQ